MQEDPERQDGDEPGVLHFERKGHSHRQPVRHPGVDGPGSEPERLRSAYMDLLKLCLCDLAGASTTSVWKDPGGTVMSRQLRGEELSIRALGVDWPLQGLTMVGLNRLDDLQECVETIVRDRVEGDLIEAGSWRGGASMLMRATLDTLGDAERSVWVADSFEGFPIAEDDRPETEHLAPVSFLAVPLEDVKGHFARFGLDHGVEFVPGFFQETLPQLPGRPWSLLRLDGDSYEATWIALECLYPSLSTGGYVIVDDYGALEECQRAVEDFRRQEGIGDPIEPVDWTGARWRKTSAPAAEPSGPRAAAGTTAVRAPLQRAERGGDTRVRSIEEIAREGELKREQDQLRERLAQAEAEIGRLRGSPLLGPRAWLGARLRHLRGR
jgi:O-methyltransferase